MRTYEELIAAQTELAHFNPNHDKLGRFSKSKFGSSSSKSYNTVDKSNKSEYNTDKDANGRSNINWKKAAIIGGVAVAGTLAVIGGYSLYKSGALDKYISNGKEAIKDIQVNRLGKSFEELDTKMIKQINGKGNITHDRQINCTHCTTSYILNSLYGKKTMAKGFNGYDEIYHEHGEGRRIEIYNDLFDGLKINDYLKEYEKNGLKFMKISDGWKDRLDAITPGSTGILHIASPLGASHVINYEKTLDGRVTLIDCQSNKIIKDGVANRLFQVNGMWKIIKSIDFSEATIKEGSERIFETMVKNI